MNVDEAIKSKNKVCKYKKYIIWESKNIIVSSENIH